MEINDSFEKALIFSVDLMIENLKTNKNIEKIIIVPINARR